MRKIAECVEDIKSILSNVERMQEYTGETSVDINELIDEILTINAAHELQNKRALDKAYDFGQIDGSHHRLWVIDQMVRDLCGDEDVYKQWVAKFEEPLENGDYYEWDCGIAP